MMITKKLFSSAILFAAIFSTKGLSASTIPVAVATPIATPVVVITPIYVQSYTYDKTIPSKFPIRFTYHKNFANIYLHDGSVWKTEYSSNIREVQSWLTTDNIVVKADSWSSGYKLYNMQRNKSINVSFSCPSYSSPSDPLLASTYIYMQYYANVDNVMTLNTAAGGVYFMEIRSSDLYKTNKWSPLDCIILGWNKNNHSWDLDYPYTLINTRTNDKVEAESVIYSY